MTRLMDDGKEEERVVDLIISCNKRVGPGDGFVVAGPDVFWDMVDGIYCSDCAVEPLPREPGLYAVKAKWWGSYDYESGHYDDWGWTVQSWQVVDIDKAPRGDVVEATEVE